MPLTDWQELAFQNLVDLYRPRYEIDPMKRIQVDTDFDLVATAIPANYKNNQSPEEVDPIGRVEQFNIFTRDEWHFAIDVEIGAQWLIHDRTVDRYGNPSPWFGQYWIVQGTAQNFPSLGERDANMRIVRANVIAHPPRHLAT